MLRPRSVRSASSARERVWRETEDVRHARKSSSLQNRLRSAPRMPWCTATDQVLLAIVPHSLLRHHDMYSDLPLLFFSGSQWLGHFRQDVLGAKSPVRNSFGNCAPVLSMMRLGHYASLHNTFLLGLVTKGKKKTVHSIVDYHDLLNVFL